MKFLFLLFFFYLYVSTSCKEYANKEPISINDTTNALRILIDSVIILPRLADLRLLKQNNPFQDSVIVLKSVVFNKHFKNLGLKVKFLSGDSICTLASLYSKKSQPFTNYLDFSFHKITDSTYSASLTNIKIERVVFYNNENDYSCLRIIDDACVVYANFKKTNNQTFIKIITDHYLND